MRKAARCLRCSGRSRRSTRIPAGWSTTRRSILVFQLGALTELLVSNGASRRPTSPAIGITNQRETTVVWDRETGEPVYQRHRVAVPPHRAASSKSSTRDRTWATLSATRRGSMPDAYFSGDQDQWILDNVPGARERAETGRAALRHGGQLARLDASTTGRSHATDCDERRAARCSTTSTSGAGTTRLLRPLRTSPRPCMPEVAARRQASSDAPPIAVLAQGDARSAALAGDQQAALFGQCCFDAGRCQEHLRHRLLPAHEHRAARRSSARRSTI